MLSSSHFRRWLSSGSVEGSLVERALLEWRRDAEVRALLEVRRWPAFWSVFCKVRSESVVVAAVLGEAVAVVSRGTSAEVGRVEGSGGGEEWKEEFLRMPVVNVFRDLGREVVDVFYECYLPRGRWCLSSESCILAKAVGVIDELE